eukprot:GHVU01215732.1.p1 GENE.GHVU01215732.1~~GHVU01215732.1.p1  ORF type:complete len:374 (+),score=57.07 GHVU01215732.1:222-1343(+)
MNLPHAAVDFSRGDDDRVAEDGAAAATGDVTINVADAAAEYRTKQRRAANRVGRWWRGLKAVRNMEIRLFKFPQDGTRTCVNIYFPAQHLGAFRAAVADVVHSGMCSGITAPASAASLLSDDGQLQLTSFVLLRTPMVHLMPRRDCNFSTMWLWLQRHVLVRRMRDHAEPPNSFCRPCDAVEASLRLIRRRVGGVSARGCRPIPPRGGGGGDDRYPLERGNVRRLYRWEAPSVSVLKKMMALCAIDPSRQIVALMPTMVVERAAAAVSIQAAWRSYAARQRLQVPMAMAILVRRAIVCIQRYVRWTWLRRRIQFLAELREMAAALYRGGEGGGGGRRGRGGGKCFCVEAACYSNWRQFPDARCVGSPSHALPT